MKDTSSRGNLVKEILYGAPVSTEATRYGLRMEPEAKKKI